MIEDPRRCDFEPREQLPICSGAERSDCFTDGQIQALETIYGEVSSGGERLYPGEPVGSEVAARHFLCPQDRCRSGWEPYIVRAGGPPFNGLLAREFFRYMAYPEKDADYELKQFDFARDVARLERIGEVMNATYTDLSAFQRRGGKLLMYFGWADMASNPVRAVEYYETVLREMGDSAPEFFRLYMMPGVFHCGGGVGCAAFDPMAALIPWVEEGEAPAELTASCIVGGEAVRTRPLCPYPKVARYDGSGDVDKAASFDCVNAGQVVTD